MSARKAPAAVRTTKDGWSRTPERVFDTSYSFRTFLSSQTEGAGLRKGKRTLARIKCSTCELLERMPLSLLKIEHVCRAAGIALGTFYIYFPNRQFLLNAVLREYIEFVRERMIERSRVSKNYVESVRQTTMAYYRLFEQNRGLMKCLISHYEDFPEVSAITSEMNRSWIEINVRSMKKRLRSQGHSGTIPEAELFRRCYALGGMVDQYLSYIFIVGDKNVQDISGTANDIIETLSHIWISALAG
jgi:AcrR family transcriptional regulator